MQFSDTANKLGIIETIDFLLFGSSTANTTEYPLADKTRNVNLWVRRIEAWIQKADGTFSYDDLNYTNLPIARTDVTLGKNDYSLPSDYVTIERIEYKDSSGIWHRVMPMDRTQVRSSIAEFYKTNGTPLFYDLFANSYWVYPAPDRTSTDGDSLRVYYTRDSANSATASAAGGAFVSTDTTKEPGFNRRWHHLLAYGGALEYAFANGRQDKIAYLSSVIQEGKLDIEDYFAFRDKDFKTRLRPRYEEVR